MMSGATLRSSRRRRPKGAWWVALGLLAAALAVSATNAPRLGLLGTQPVWWFDAPRPKPKLAAVFVSGDMGFRFGMGADVARAVAAQGVPVMGISSPVVFAGHRTRAEADGVITGAIRQVMARTGASRVLLMGQSYGSDIVATTAPDLPADLRRHVAAIALTVPATDVYFRADPSGLAYRGEPDHKSVTGMRALNWAPVVCIYGVKEADSLCPHLAGTGAHVIGLPGGHFLERNEPRLIATILPALRAALPAFGQPNQTSHRP